MSRAIFVSARMASLMASLSGACFLRQPGDIVPAIHPKTFAPGPYVLVPYTLTLNPNIAPRPSPPMLARPGFSDYARLLHPPGRSPCPIAY